MSGHPVIAAVDIVDEAAAVIERARIAGIARAASALAGSGAASCIGCGDEIEPSRRAALPSARRCITCQSRVERRARQHARDL
jgi:phage/conjugal plasmid C-4 type zinc finger TraR family protein